MTLSSRAQDNTGWMAQVVADGEDAGHDVRYPACYEDCIECPMGDLMFVAKSVLDADGRVLFLEENNSPNG